MIDDNLSKGFGVESLSEPSEDLIKEIVKILSEYSAKFMTPYKKESRALLDSYFKRAAIAIIQLYPSEKWPPEPKGTPVAAISTANCFEHISKRDTGTDDVLKANGELLDVLKKIEHLCESNSPAHDEIWAIAYDAIRKFK